MKTTNFVRQLQARATVARHRAATQTAMAPQGAPDAKQARYQDMELETGRELARAQQFRRQQEQQAQLDAILRSQLERGQQQQTQQQQQQQQQQAKVEAPRDELDLSFNNTKVVYKSKTLGELVRSYLVLGLCKSDFLVANNDRLMKLSRAILGKRVFTQLMRSTFYAQFVAGQDEQDIVPVIKHLRSFGVKTILDYSAEEDVPEEEVREEVRAEVERTKDECSYLAQMDGDSPLRRYQQSTDFADRRKYLPVARTYFYHGESQCERNLEIFFKAIEAVAKSTGNTGFAAIKLTALGRPRLLMKLSKIIDYMRSLEGAGVSGAGQMQAESLTELLARFNGLKQSDINTLDEDEEEMLFNLMRRVNRIAAYASQVGGARCMIDAEQTYMQPAINMIAMELMRTYNRREPIIFNTYQCYLKSAYDQVRQDLAMARRENFFFGAKLVRGAYMDQERARAAKLNYEDPINESFEATSAMYERTLSYLMGEIERELKLAASSARAGEPGQQQALPGGVTNDVNCNDDVARQWQLQRQQMDAMNSRRISIMVASHNEGTVRFALKEMERRGIKPWHRLICFGQLYGMCDHVSFMLGQSGYSVYKYMPYGPVEEVLPYLGRRAIENHGFLSKLERERGLLAREILSRVASLRLFYKPLGTYTPT